MAEYYSEITKAMSIAQPFKLSLRQPLDARAICDTLEELQARKIVYVGMLVFVKEKGEFYKCDAYNAETKVYTWTPLVAEQEGGSSVKFATSDEDIVNTIPNESGLLIITTPHGTVRQYTNLDKDEEGNPIKESAQLVNRVVYDGDEDTKGHLVVEQRVYSDATQTWTSSTILDMSEYARVEDLDGTDYYTGEPTTEDVGGIPKGTKFTNEPIGNVIDMLLHPYKALTISVSGSGNYYYGTTNDMSIVLTITKGSKEIVSATLDGEDVKDADPKKIERTVTEDASFDAVVSDGQTTVTKSATAKYYYKCYVGVTETLPTTKEEVLAGTVTSMITGTTYKHSADTGGDFKYYWIAIPTTMGVTAILDPNQFAQGFSSEGLSTVTIEGVNYKIFSPTEGGPVIKEASDNWYYNYNFTKSAKV